MAWQATLKSSSTNAGKKFSESFAWPPARLTGHFSSRVTTSEAKKLSSSRKTSKNRHHGCFTAYRSMRRKERSWAWNSRGLTFSKMFFKRSGKLKVREKKKRGRKEERDGKFAPSLKEKFCLLFSSSRLFLPTFSMKKRPSSSLERLVYVTHSSSIKTPVREKTENFRSLIWVEKVRGSFFSQFSTQSQVSFSVDSFLSHIEFLSAFTKHFTHLLSPSSLSTSRQTLFFVP